MEKTVLSRDAKGGQGLQIENCQQKKNENYEFEYLDTRDSNCAKRTTVTPNNEQ